MITQLMRIRNAFLEKGDERAYGYIVGKEPYRNSERLIIAWVQPSFERAAHDPETLSAHDDNVVLVTPYVFITNERKAQ